MHFVKGKNYSRVVKCRLMAFFAQNDATLLSLLLTVLQGTGDSSSFAWDMYGTRVSEIPPSFFEELVITKMMVAESMEAINLKCVAAAKA